MKQHANPQNPVLDRRARSRSDHTQFSAGESALLASLECIEQGLCVVDGDLRFSGFNSRFFTLLEIPRDLFGIGDAYEEFVRFVTSRGSCRPSEMDFLVSERVRSFEPTAFGEQVAERTLSDGRTLEIRYSPMPDGGFVCVYADITERKRTEEGRRQSERRALDAEQQLSDAIECVPEGFAIYDKDERLVRCNNAYRDLFAAASHNIVPGASFEDMIRQEALDLDLFDRGEDGNTWVRRRLERFRSPEGAFEHRLRDGTWLLVSEQRTSDGGLVSVLTDITAIKSREDALRQSEERFEKAFHASPTIISVSSLEEGRVYNVNDTWCDTLGFARDEVIGKRVQELETWADYAMRDAVMDELKRGEPVRHRETRFQARSGRTVDFIFSAEITEFQGEECLLFFAHDISPQKAVEQALTESEHRYKDFTDAASDWVWETDAEMRFTYLSDRVEQVTGFSPEWHHGKTREEVGVTAAEPEHWKEFQAAVAARKPFRELLLKRELEDGQTQWIRTRGMPFYDETGAFAGYRGAASVVTELVEARRQADEAAGLLRDAIENLPVGFALFDADDRLSIFNKRYRDIFWRDPSAIQAGKSFVEMSRLVVAHDLLADMPEDPDGWVQERVSAHQRMEHARDLKLANGRWVHVEDHATSHGGCVTTYADVTLLKEREEALEESQARLQDFLDTATDVLWETDSEHRFSFLTSRIRQDAPGGTNAMLGQTRWEVAGVEDPYVDDQWQAHIADLEEHRAYKDFQYDSRYSPDDVIHVRSSGKPIFDRNGEFAGYRGTAVDETGRVKALRRAEAAEALLTDAMNSVPIGIAIYDDDDRLSAFNEPYKVAVYNNPDAVRPGVAYEEIARRNAETGSVAGLDPEDKGAVEAWVANRVRNHILCTTAQEVKLANGRWLRVEEHPTRMGGRVAIRTDITTLKQREEELQESEQRFRNFAESTSDWFYETDEEHRFTFTSIDVKARYGLDVDTVLGKTRWEVSLHDESVEEFWREHRADHDAHRPFRDFQYPWLKDNNGRQLYLKVSGTPVFGGDGEFRGYRGVVTDVTAQVEADHRAEQAETMLLGAIESADGGFVFFDQKDRLVTCNRTYRAMFPELEDLLVPGTAYEEIIAAIVDRGLVPVEDSERGHWILNRMHWHREGQRNYDAQLQDGRWIRLMEYRGADGSTIGFRTDITELKEKEHALLESEERFRDFAESASDWLWEMDEDFRFVSTSESFGQASGTDGNYVQGMTRWQLAGVEDPESDPFWRNHLADLKAHRPFRDLRYSLQAEGGMLLFVRVHGKPIFDEHGEFKGYRGVGIDETSRVLAAERVEMAEQRLSQTIETADGGIMVFDAQERLVTCNKVMRELAPSLSHLFAPGLPYTELVEKTAYSGLVKDALGREDVWIEEQMALHETHARNLDLELVNGQWIRFSEYRAHDGGTIAFRSDITELKQQEQKLREQARLLQRTLESMDQGITMVDADLNITLHNRRLLELLDIPEEAVGENATVESLVRFNAERGEYGPGAVDELTREKTAWFHDLDVSRVSHHTRPDGTILEVRRSPTSDGGFVSVFTDVTERATAERQRREAEVRLHKILDTIPIILWAVDTDGVFTLREGKALDTKGIEPHLRDGVPIETVYKDRPDIMDFIQRALSGEEFVVKHDTDGGIFESSMGPLRSESGEIIGAVGVSADVTEREHAQAQLIQSAKLATLGEMATSLAHELNQPLNVIRMAADSTLERLDDGDRDFDNVHAKLERISRQTERAASIIDHMRIFGRKSDGVPEEVDPRQAVDGALSIMTERLRLHGIDLSVDLPERCHTVIGHEVQLEQVVLNILSNAFDALEARDPAQGAKAIDIRLVEQEPDGTIEIIVEDTGGGLKEEAVTKLFEPFFTTKEIGKGTGLGLSISYGIVTDMGGTITAQNTADGTQIKIVLPVAEDERVTA